MSLFSEAGLGDFQADQIPDSQYTRAEDGTYEATVADVYVRKGTTNKPDNTWICVDYAFDDGHTETEWFGMPAHPESPSEKELMKLGFYKRRLGDLGVPKEEINTVTATELIGKRVAVTLRTAKGYQNVARVDLLDEPQEQLAAADPGAQFAGRAQAPAAPRTATTQRRANPFGS